MDTTVPVLAVISGDTDTIRERRDVLQSSLAGDARCIARRLIADDAYDLSAFWRDELVKDTQEYELVNGESRRRHLAFRLARTDEGPWPW